MTNKGEAWIRLRMEARARGLDPDQCGIDGYKDPDDGESFLLLKPNNGTPEIREYFDSFATEEYTA